MISLVIVSCGSSNGASTPDLLMAKCPSHTKKPVDRDEATHEAYRGRDETEHLNNVNLMLVEIIVLA